MRTTQTTKIFLIGFFFPLFGLVHSYAITPPTQVVINKSDDRWYSDLDESLWTANKNVTITEETVKLKADRSINTIEFTGEADRAGVNLGGNMLTVGKGGIISTNPNDGYIINGTLTSSSGTLSILTKADSLEDNPHLITIYASIADNKGKSVGIDISRDDKGTGHRGVRFAGDQGNTFTGKLRVSGNTVLNLEKEAGALAIRGNIDIIDGALVRIIYDEQISNISTVLLKSSIRKASRLQFNGRYQASLKETIAELVVEGNGIVQFNGDDNNGTTHGTRTLILEDLIVRDNSLLKITGWKDGRDHLLVRKNSGNLADALKKIEFEGHDTRTVNKRDFDNEYWEIWAQVPEPTTYGAIIGSVALGLLACRNRPPITPRTIKQVTATTTAREHRPSR